MSAGRGESCLLRSHLNADDTGSTLKLIEAHAADGRRVHGEAVHADAGGACEADDEALPREGVGEDGIEREPM